ncbi:DUF47 domain-containing protein (plasmid) [Deinococcus sp. KNUC1210]|uniref:DUF47 domain-containing protein n=1 Tax=Deinococcus sp. KNUC1210 TaxID=2917691 RepID=UPI001EF0CC0A|nr:DUF47 domain-containing protein [Deinococcus sp. KNUC1210]ULH17107.1 DUF47 domain-containing protein [Deinococcus sp. KNUC1210]
MALSRFMPRNPRFSQLFTQQAQNAVTTAAALVDLLADYTDIGRKVQRLRDLEHEGDRLSRETVNILAGLFIVPFDREDILELNTHLDDLVDDIEEAGRKLMLYRIQQPVPQALLLARTVQAQAELLTKAMPLLENLGNSDELKRLMQEVRALEDEADALGDEVQLHLYDGVTEVRGMVDAMRMGEIVGLIEQATDQAQRVASAVESILLKNA